MKDDKGHGLLGDVRGAMVGGLLSAEALCPLPSGQYSRAKSRETGHLLGSSKERYVPTYLKTRGP